MEDELIVQKKPRSPITEIFRTLRTNMQFMNSKKSSKILLVTSTIQGEGKTWISSNLAIAFAQAGKKVVLVDTDMRKGRINKLFQVNAAPGLSNYLSGFNEIGMSDGDNILKYINQTEVENLYVISAGNIPPNPSELLSSERTTIMLDKLREVFDIIILDGTPSLIVTDSLILSRIVDSTLIVASHKYTKKDNLLKIKKSIENIGGKIAGVVYNRVPINIKKYKSKYYYTPSNSSGKRLEFEKKDGIEKYEDLNRKKVKEIINELESYSDNGKIGVTKK